MVSCPSSTWLGWKKIFLRQDRSARAHAWVRGPCRSRHRPGRPQQLARWKTWGGRCQPWWESQPGGQQDLQPWVPEVHHDMVEVFLETRGPLLPAHGCYWLLLTLHDIFTVPHYHSEQGSDYTEWTPPVTSIRQNKNKYKKIKKKKKLENNIF